MLGFGVFPHSLSPESQSPAKIVATRLFHTTRPLSQPSFFCRTKAHAAFAVRVSLRRYYLKSRRCCRLTSQSFACAHHCRGLYLSLQSGFFTRTALRTVSLRFSSAGGCRLPSPMSARYFLVTCALAVRCRCCDHLMSVINLSSPTAVAGRILPANSSQTQCLQGFNPLVDHWSFEPLCGLLSSGEMHCTQSTQIRQPLFLKFFVDCGL